MAAVGQILSCYYTVAGGGGGYDADAQTYFTALATAGVTPTSPQMTNINTFVVNAKANGWWTLKKAIYFPVWSNASANAINMKNPGTYNLTFFNSPTHTSNGVAWNGTNQYANTGLAPSDMGINSVSISFYSQTSNTITNKYDIGSYRTSPTYTNTLMKVYSAGSNVGVGLSNDNEYTRAYSGSTLGFFSASRTSSTVLVAFKNGAKLGATITNASNATVNTSPFFLATTSGDGSLQNYCSARKGSYYDIGDGLTDSQESSHYTDVQALHTAFSIAQ